ncbi:MAG: putative glycoside hydrolase [Halobacteriota archaeon]
MAHNSLRHRIISMFFALFMLASVLTPLCANAQPGIELGPVKHDISSLSTKSAALSEVVKDNISISGKTAPGSQVLIKETIYNSTNETRASVSPDGSFNAIIALEIGPGFTQGVEKGEVKLSVEATRGAITKQIQVPLANTTSSPASELVGTALKAGVAGYPRTFVAYDNPWLFYIGQYVNDGGVTVQTSKDDAATQLAKFSSVSLHYTEDASSITLIKQKNPTIKVFAYINPVFCYQSSDPNSEYQQVVRHHPEWFLYPDAASRKKQTNPIVVSGSEQVMDLTTGWREEVVKVSKDALTKGFDGLYIDCICDNPSFCYGNGSRTAPSGDWHAALNAYLDQVRVNGKLNFYNGQSPVVDSSNQDFLSRTEGWMDEGFISYRGWQLSAIDMPQYAASKNKFVMFYAANADANARHFYFTSALLSDGYFFYSSDNTCWFSDYRTFLGDPSGQAYQVLGLNGVWARDYTGAKVIVNPTSSNITVNVSGYRDLNGKALTSVTIGPNDGVIVKKRIPTQLSLSARKATPSANQATTFSGILQTSVSPSTRLASQPIYLLWSTDKTNWSRTVSSTATTNADGVYAFSGSLPVGTYYFRAYYDGNAQYKEAFSSVVTVVVR